MINFFKTSTFLTLLFLTYSYSLSAQQWSRTWYPGHLVSISGDTLEGDLRYDIENDAVQIRLENERVHTFSGKKVLTFEIQEHPRRSKRRFYALPYEQRNSFFTSRLFEVLYEGKLTLLCRPYMEHINNVDTREDDSGKKKNDPYYEYYFLNDDGIVHLYRPRLGRLLSFMSAKHRDVRNYMRQHHLRYDQMRDLVRITAYYNALPAASSPKEQTLQPE
ncbi:hypothetical protein D770_25080 [Flammeovirgaceae bacterium 311]|nr:hypothetical protein D770_25080 [Flammeovirgaceae bacterium 311]